MRADWRRLADAGMSSLAAHVAPSNRPHITMLVRSASERPAIEGALFGAALRLMPLEVILAEPIVFAHGDRGVLARRIEPSPPLTRLHALIHDAVPAGEDAAHTAPGEWTPHVTLARRLKLASVPDARQILGPTQVGTIVGLRRWDSEYTRVTELGGTELGGGELT